MALDLYYISKDIDDKKFDEARKKLSKSIEITNQIKSENHYDGPYWKMYDRLVNGTIEGVQQSHQPSAK